MMADPGIILFGKKITSFPETAGESHGGSGSLMDGGDKDKPEDESRDNPKTPSINESEEPQTTGTENNTVDLQPKSLKKPDKILPCPRCESMNTKFCYYNNSNVNQPRHFCKSCQRYWTAGGTMRSMPVGAGRRKKKIPPSHCRYIISQEASKSVVAPEVLSFGPNLPNLSVVSTTGREDSNPVVEKTQDFNRIPSQVHWISYNNPWNPAIPMPIPAICPPGYPPMQIYPSPYWNSVPWLPSVTHPPNLSILGKHSTDGEADEEVKKQKNSVLIPKTLRIDDPDEAAKSSIWATLGIKNENISRGDLFKAFQEKGDEKKKHPVTEPSSVLQANPAAFSRSLCFQERA